MVRARRQDRAVFFPGGYRRRRNKAQTILEYSALIMCLVAALIGMQIYVKRGMQGKFKQIADEMGQQYSPGRTTGSSAISYSSTSVTHVQTLSEKQINDLHPGKNVDLNGDGDYIDEDVYATESVSYLGTPVDSDGDGVNDSIVGGSTTSQTGDETVGEMETHLYQR